ncbi:MAG: transglutaminase family protein [Pirellulales bacterium]|nr:transglutaminase family protein [Pirellulales bacterium]
MKQLRITHDTTYYYHQPVTFGPHRALMRPREGHDVNIVGGRLEIEPAADIRWLRDCDGNSVAILSFKETAPKLRVMMEIDVNLRDDNPIECLIDPEARMFPFQYAPDEQVALVPYRLPSYPYTGSQLHQWLSCLYHPGQVIDTFELLNKLNEHIYKSLQYNVRYDHGVQLPNETLQKGSGSCRDYAVLMMEAARYWGFASRFVTGYIQMGEGQHGSTHAWTEIYLPGAGWRGFDPTNNKLADIEHISVAVAREQEKAMPLSGSWEGPADAFDRLEVSVQVVAKNQQPPSASVAAPLSALNQSPSNNGPTGSSAPDPAIVEQSDTAPVPQ